MAEKIKVLHIIYGAGLGGISSFLLNCYSYIDREYFKFDFAVEDRKIGHNGKMLEKLGAKIYYLPSKSRHIGQYKHVLQKIIREGKYNIVHSHIDFSSYIPLYFARQCGVKYIIAHAHAAGDERKDESLYKVKKLLSRIVFSISRAEYAACSREAARFTFGKRNGEKACIIPNAIAWKKYQYSELHRKKIRAEYGIEKDEFVVGLAARLTAEKNIAFALDVMKKVLEKKPAKMMIAGGGPLYDELKDRTENLRISQFVRFLGWKENTDEIFSAFDIMLLPSKAEGFGIVALEAAASGMPVLMSEGVPKSLNFLERGYYLPAGKGSEQTWADKILELSENVYRTNGREVIANGYEISQAVHILENLYSMGIER